MDVSRRQILKLSGLATAGLVGASSSATAGDADPRAEPVEGSKPNENVPATQVGTIPGQNGTVPAGDWIHHSNGWVTRKEYQDDCGLPEFLNATTQVFTIDGEEFVLDSLDDWEFTDPDPDPDDHCSAGFEYTTPPKPRGTTYEMRWDVYGDEDRFPVVGAFPFVNQIEVVESGDNGGSGRGNGRGN